MTPVPIVSIRFAAFVALVLVVYLTLPGRAQRWWLVATSAAFYATWAWHLPLVLAMLTLLNFSLARWVRGQAGLFWLGVAGNVAVLAFMRHLAAARPFFAVGLSFCVLQAIAYLADLRSGVLREPLSLRDLALYLLYFPKLTAGPIERPRAFLAQLDAERTIGPEDLTQSATLVGLGLMRKLVLAAPLFALLPSDAFAQPRAHAPGVLAAALVTYAFAVYNDFAGYTSIVRGVSGLFGIQLSPNFAQPVFSASFTELWTRWHMSLSFWLRDYIYLPLSRAILRRSPGVWSPANLIVPPLTTMLASGLWHGASAGMLVWGGLHGVFLMIERVAGLVRGPRRERAAGPRLLSRSAVLVLGIATIAPFLTSPRGAFLFWGRLFSPYGWRMPDGWLVLLVAVSVALDGVQARWGETEAVLRWPRPARAAFAVLVVVLTYLFSRETVAPFVYQGF